MQEVIDFLGRCGAKFGAKTSEYQRLVYENDVDGEVLSDLDDDNMLRLGIKSFGHRCVHCAMLPCPPCAGTCVFCPLPVQCLAGLTLSRAQNLHREAHQALQRYRAREKASGKCGICFGAV